MRRVAFAVAVVLCLVGSAVSDEGNHEYEAGSALRVWAHSVNPFSNPQERYKYFALPLCDADTATATTTAAATTSTPPLKKETGLAEALLGYEFAPTRIALKFRTDVASATECDGKVLSQEQYAALERAVRGQYWYQWVIDDLPVWGLVGEMAEAPGAGAASVSAYVYTHRDITVGYNGARIVEVTLNTSGLRALKDFAPRAKDQQGLRMTWSVKWVHQPSAPYESRMDRYLDKAFFEHQVHWFSLFNCAMLALFLAGVVAMVLMRTVHRDFASSSSSASKKDDPEAQAISSASDFDLGEESGWKQVAGDVFRQPSSPVLFSSVVGTGAQLFAVAAVALLTGAMGNRFLGRGDLLAWLVFLYTVASLASGFRSGNLYASFKGRTWIRVVALTAALFPAICAVAWAASNSVATAYGSISRSPVSSQVAVASLWIFGVLPLCFVGTLVGRHWGSSEPAPGTKPANPFPGPIPPRRWFQGRTACVLLSGVLPFGALFIELYFAFAALWHYKFYYCYGFALIVFVAFVVVTACVAVIVVYYLLNAEDYRWQWSSFMAGASTGLYTFAYCVYFYSNRTQMSGGLQATQYYAFSAVLSAAIGFLAGSVSYSASSWFVRRIYATGKTD